jgi:hypothetical protein
MGDVIELFPRPKDAPWIYGDLRGQTPIGHTGAKLSPRGKVLLAEEQVWVEIHNDRLWVLVEKWEVRKTFYPHNVLLFAYRGSEVRMLAETGLRSTMRVWDEWAAFKQECMTKFDYCAQNDPASPWRGRPNAVELARNHFGLDAKGNRIRD